MEKNEFTPPFLSREQIAVVGGVTSIAALQAGNSLSRLSNIPVSISVSEVANLRLSEIPALFGGLDSPAVGVLVPFHGDMEGNALLLFPEEGISELEQILFGQQDPVGEELKISDFSEIGNILTGTLLTVLSSLAERIVVSLPPVLVKDMAGAILDTILAEVGTWSDEVTVLVFELTDSEGASLVRSVLIPGSAGIELFLEAADRLRPGR